LQCIRYFTVGWAWGLTALSTRFRSYDLYRTFKVELYYKYYNLIDINSWSEITQKNI